MKPSAGDAPAAALDERRADEAGATERRAPVDLDVTVVCPVQTGDADIGQLVAALGAVLTRLGKSHEFVLVFDGVRGAAWTEAQRLQSVTEGRVKALMFQRAFGESACLQAAFEHARGALILTTPQYVQVDPEALAAMLARIAQGADFVAPWRQERVDPLLNRLQSAAFNVLMRGIIRSGLHDLNCYFRLLRREVLENLTVYGDMYRFLPVIALRAGYKVVEEPVRHLREWGGTHFFGIGVYVRRFLDVLGVVFLTRFTHKPLRFFGTLGTILALAGAALLAVLFVQWAFLDWNLFGRPTFFLGVMLVVLGVQVIGFGLVGEIIIFTQARNLREYRVERIYE